MTGPKVNELVVVKNGEKFELTLPPGAYTVELNRGSKTLSWKGLKTGRTDHVFEEPQFRFTPETVGEGFDELWKTMDRNYSYFALKPDVDWAKLRDEYRPKAIKAKSADELAAVLKEMLGHLKDGHVWIDLPDGKQVGTHRTPWTYNGNRKVILAQLTDTTECPDTVPDVAFQEIHVQSGGLDRDVKVRGDCKPGFNRFYDALKSAVGLTY